MSKSSEIKQVIRSIANGAGSSDILFEAEVTAVQDTTITIKYQGLTHENVRLSAGFSQSSNVILQLPKVGSLVLVADISEGKMRDLVVLLQEQTEKVVINGGEYGGLIKIEELVDKINKIEKQVNDLKTALNGWTPSYETVLKSALTQWLVNPDLSTERKDIEDELVTH